MHAAVVYESMYGNTRAVAEAIAAGIGPDATVLQVRRATPDQLAVVDLLVVGAPTHVRGLSRASTRRAAHQAAGKPGSGLSFEPGAEGLGVREWLPSLADLSCQAAAFDTRIDVPAFFGGRAAPRIARALRHHGAQLVHSPTSFLVDKYSRLLDGEQARARAWGQVLATTAARARTSVVRART